MIIFNVTTFNVGFYYCHQGLLNSSIYLYVNGKLMQNPTLIELTILVLDSSLTSSPFYRAFTYLEWKEIVLPCRPSMPNVQVTYEKDPIMFTNIVQNHTKVSFFFENKETKIKVMFQMTYSPTRGFSRPLARADGDTGQYKCFYSR